MSVSGRLLGGSHGRFPGGMVDYICGWVALLMAVSCFGRSHGLEIILTEQLFPGGIPVEEQSRHWVLAFSTFDENEKKALQFILLAKQRQEFGPA